MNQIIIGTLARAKQRHEVRVCFFVCLGNHMHLLLWTEDARELSKFMGYFLSKLAREVGRLTRWKEKIFGRRYTAIVVSDEEEAQIARLRYQLAHGAKEDLVERPRDWPGVHCVRALLEGEALEGSGSTAPRSMQRAAVERSLSLFSTRRGRCWSSILYRAGSICRKSRDAPGPRPW